MAYFEVAVTEMRATEVLYLVEAGDADEAERKAERGDTVKETDVGRFEVSDRHVTGDPTLVSN